ncbi:FAD-dependent oxidoreductase [Nocardia nova]|uniref:FAD-dependent oxidoreductase n=1 Tax=Nocardia nova TaxID=37330 RepID=UPI0007C83AEB|nr:FAD-dependent monooxygenase [Nocardia nova]
MNDVQVVVAGADLTGLTTALGLARAGIDVMVADTGCDDIAAAHCAHDWSVLPGLDRLGVLDDALRTGFTSARWCLRVLRTGERLDFDLGALAPVTPFPFTLHIDQAALCRILVRHLAGQPSVRVLRDVRLSEITRFGDGVELAFDDATGAHRLRADWVVGSDGTRSAVRRGLGLGFPGYTWPERCVTALVEADLARQGYAATTLQVDARYGAVVQRADDNCWRYTFAEPSTLPEAGVADRLSDALRNILGDAPARILENRCARMHQRTAPTYRLGRVLLAGEAAHVTNRITGLSPITAFFDAFHLIDALRAVVTGQAGDGVLDEYARDRKRVFDDHAAPMSAARHHLISQISDRRELETELAYYRRAAAHPDDLRDLMLLSRDLEGRSPMKETTN